MANIGDAINAAGKVKRVISNSYSKRAMKSTAYKATKKSVNSNNKIAKGVGLNLKFRQKMTREALTPVLKREKGKVIARDAGIATGVVAAGVGIKKMRKKNSG